MIVGVLDVQGDVTEHVRALKKAIASTGKSFSVRRVKDTSSFNDIDALVIPGGESTTIGKLLMEYGIDVSIKKFADSGRPVMGTCCGLIILAKRLSSISAMNEQPVLGLMDIDVDRNAFGTQKESFETDLDIKGIGAYPGVFIRAPAITRTGKSVDVLSKYRGKVVMAQQGNMLACAFHPELTEDVRLHLYFLGMLDES